MSDVLITIPDPATVEITIPEPSPVVVEIQVPTPIEVTVAPTIQYIGGKPEVTQPITVYGVSQGQYVPGDVIPSGTQLEAVVKKMLQVVIPPTYTSPSLSLSGIITGEVGSNVTPILTPNWQQRDGGGIISYELKRNNVSILTNPTAAQYTDTPLILSDTPISFQSFIQYNQGPVKVDNQGNPYPTGQIQAGSISSNTVSFIGRRNLFYGMDSSTSPVLISSDIRSLASKLLNPVNGTAFTLNIPVGARRITIAYPATLRDISSIKYVELGNGEVKDTFSLTTINVLDANSSNPILYKVYTYIAGIPFGGTATYNVTI